MGRGGIKNCWEPFVRPRCCTSLNSPDGLMRWGTITFPILGKDACSQSQQVAEQWLWQSLSGSPILPPSMPSGTVHTPQGHMGSEVGCCQPYHRSHRWNDNGTGLVSHIGPWSMWNVGLLLAWLLVYLLLIGTQSFIERNNLAADT